MAHKVLKNSKLNLKGISLGDGFVKPKTFYKSYPSFLYKRNVISKNVYDNAT